MNKIDSNKVLLDRLQTDRLVLILAHEIDFWMFSLRERNSREQLIWTARRHDLGFKREESEAVARRRLDAAHYEGGAIQFVRSFCCTGDVLQSSLVKVVYHRKSGFTLTSRRPYSVTRYAAFWLCCFTKKGAFYSDQDETPVVHRFIGLCVDRVRARNDDRVLSRSGPYQLFCRVPHHVRTMISDQVLACSSLGREEILC